MLTRDELIHDAEGDRVRPKGPQGVDRDALIEKARECGWDEFEAGELADFVLPLIAQAREEGAAEAYSRAAEMARTEARAATACQHSSLAQQKPETAYAWGVRANGLTALAWDLDDLAAQPSRAPGETEHRGRPTFEDGSAGSPPAPSTTGVTARAASERTGLAKGAVVATSDAARTSPAWADAIAREIAVLRLRLIVEPTDIAALLTERLGPCIAALTLCESLTEERGLKRQIRGALEKLRGEREKAT